MAHNPFPQGVKKIPSVVEESWEQIQAHQLSPEKQRQISYYINDGGQWCMKIGDIANILMTNETAKNNPDTGVHVVEGYSYFSLPAFHERAKRRGKSLPSRALWEKMAQFLGGFTSLTDILQIPRTGRFVSDGRGMLHEELHYYAYLWSNDDNECLKIGHSSSSTDAKGTVLCLNMRLLDKAS